MRDFSFEKLYVYHKSKSLIKEIYELVGMFPNYEKFGLSSQLQRSIVSVASNIAEGSGRRSIKEKIHFLEISYGSLMEAYCQLSVAADLLYISFDQLNNIKPKFIEISAMITSLVKNLEAQLIKNQNNSNPLNP